MNVPPGIIKSLEKARVTYLAFRDGARNHGEPFPSERIPAAVKKDAERWVRKMVRPVWIPENLREVFVGTRAKANYVPPVYVDFLSAEYTRGGSSFRIVDGAGVSILWSNPNIQIGPDKGKTVVLVAQCLLNIPESVAEGLEARVKPFGNPKAKLFLGRLRTRGKSSPDKPVWWYDNMRVWLAPGYFYISASKYDAFVLADLARPRSGEGLKRFLVKVAK